MKNQIYQPPIAPKRFGSLSLRERFDCIAAMEKRLAINSENAGENLQADLPKENNL
jgi:hypothetical protein